MVSEVNKAVRECGRRRPACETRPADRAISFPQLNELASHLITPPIRYSKPELQTHITYLYSLTNATDQKIGHDAVERYQELRKELDEMVAALNKVLGPEK